MFFFWSTDPKPINGANEFTAWLSQNVESVQAGRASYEGIKVTPQSTIVRYLVCSSFLFFMTRQLSPLMLEGSSEAKSAYKRCTLITLLTGWWGFGFFLTPFYLIKNLQGGERLTVADLIYNTDKLKTSADNFKFGPGQIMIGAVLAMIACCLCLQAFIYLRKHIGL